MHLVAVVLLEIEREPCNARERSGDADRGARVVADLVGHAVRQQRAHRGRSIVQLSFRRRVRVEEALGETNRADVEAVVPAQPVRGSCDELGRAAADVDDHRPVAQSALGRDAAKHQQRLVVSGEKPGLEPVAPLDLAEERLAVLRVANCARRDQQRSLGAERFQCFSIVGQDVPYARDGDGEEAAARIDALAQARDARLAVDVGNASVLDVRDEQTRGIRAEIDGCNTAHKGMTVSPEPWVESGP